MDDVASDDVSCGAWLTYVNSARGAHEQNVIALHTDDGDVIYEACRDVPRHGELLVWYPGTESDYPPLLGFNVKDMLDARGHAGDDDQGQDRYDKFMISSYN
jgi:hypothetical protein